MPPKVTASGPSGNTSTSTGRRRSIHQLDQREMSPQASGRRLKKSTTRDWNGRKKNDWPLHANANWSASADNANKRQLNLQMGCGSRVCSHTLFSTASLTIPVQDEEG
jgi:hypothetical protein